MMAVVTYVKGQPGPSVDVDDSHDEDYDDHYILLTRKIEVAEAARAAYSKPLPAGISDIVCKIVSEKILQNTAKILYAISNMSRIFFMFWLIFSVSDLYFLLNDFWHIISILIFLGPFILFVSLISPAKGNEMKKDQMDKKCGTCQQEYIIYDTEDI